MDNDVKFKRIQCLDRAMDIISLVCRSSGMTMKEIANAMGIKVGTAYNIVKTLSSRGFLANSNGIYTVGASLGLMASKWDVQHSLPVLVQPIINEIALKTGDESSLVVMQDGKVEIISGKNKQSSQEFVQYYHTCWNYPLYLSTGRTLLAFGDEQEWDEEIRKHLETGPITDDEKDWDVQRWKEMLMQVRANGYAIITPRLPVHGAKQSLGFPLFNPLGRIIAAIGVTITKKNHYNQEHFDMIRDVAFEVIKNNPLF